MVFNNRITHLTAIFSTKPHENWLVTSEIQEVEGLEKTTDKEFFSFNCPYLKINIFKF